MANDKKVDQEAQAAPAEEPKPEVKLAPQTPRPINKGSIRIRRIPSPLGIVTAVTVTRDGRQRTVQIPNFPVVDVEPDVAVAALATGAWEEHPDNRVKLK